MVIWNKSSQEKKKNPLDRIRAGDLQVTMFSYSLTRYQLRHKGSGLVDEARANLRLITYEIKPCIR